MREGVCTIFKQIGGAVLLVAWGGGFCARTQIVGAAIPSGIPSGDHPSNGVVELIVMPAPAPGHRPHALTEPPEAYAPWDGLLNVSVRNISLGATIVDGGSWDRDFTVEVLDSTGKPVPMTEHSKSIAEAASRPRDPFGHQGPAYRAKLMPGQDSHFQMDVSQIYQVVPGRAYKIRIKRSAGLPKVDEYGKPLQQRELSCTVIIDERGVLR
jgi:hypothetical protein